MEEQSNPTRLYETSEKHNLSPEESKYLALMADAEDPGELWDAYAESVKSMGLEQLQWLEPQDFAASIKIEENRKAETHTSLERTIEKFGLSRDEVDYLKGMMDSPEAYSFVEAYAESIQSLGLDQLVYIEPLDFAASVQLEEERKIQGTDEEALKTPSPKKPQEEGGWVLRNAQSFLKKNEELLEEKLKKKNSGPTDSLRYQRERQLGRNRAELKKELDQHAMNSIKCDILLEMANEEVDHQVHRLRDKYWKIDSQIVELIQETERTNENSPTSSIIKDEVRKLIPDKHQQLIFFKHLGTLNQKISKRKQIRTRSIKYDTLRDQVAKSLGILEQTEAFCERKRPVVKAAMLAKKKEKKNYEK